MEELNPWNSVEKVNNFNFCNLQYECSFRNKIRYRNDNFSLIENSGYVVRKYYVVRSSGDIFPGRVSCKFVRY